MELIDTHCHLDFPAFDHDRSDVLRRCREQGITKIIVPGVEAKYWDRLLTLCKQEEGLYPALGLHPMFIDQHQESGLELLKERIQKDRPIAVGEIGLDFYVKGLDQEKQQYFFEQQLIIAREANLPVLLHVRKAHDQTLQTLKKIKVPGGIAHAFNGSRQQAEQYIELGFKLGFGGMLTYERSKKLRQLARELPLESIVLETDAPDMTVAAHQGERNSPEYLTDCFDVLIELRKENRKEIIQQLFCNSSPLNIKDI